MSQHAGLAPPLGPVGTATPLVFGTTVGTDPTSVVGMATTWLAGMTAMNVGKIATAITWVVSF